MAPDAAAATAAKAVDTHRPAIAEQRQIAEVTARDHVQRILSRLQVSDRTAAAAAAAAVAVAEILHLQDAPRPP